MKYFKSFGKYKESLVIDLSVMTVDIIESLSVISNIVLDSIDAEEVDIHDTLKLKKEDNLDLDLLSDNIDFINSVSSLGLKKSNVELSDDYETFISKPCRFIMIYNIESSELENPVYIMFQSWNDTLSKWDDSKLYKVNDDIKKFYDKLSSKTIEVNDSGDKYIYVTSNTNEWILQNVEKENDTFKKYMRKEDFEKMVNDEKVIITII
jgi:hypothetical protein